jgi:hypothetical protein
MSNNAPGNESDGLHAFARLLALGAERLGGTPAVTGSGPTLQVEEAIVESTTPRPEVAAIQDFSRVSSSRAEPTGKVGDKCENQTTPPAQPTLFDMA